MKKLDCFKIYSDAYEYDFDHGEIDMDLDFYLKEAKKARGPVLEIACGTGRLTIPIAKQKVNITGLDVSSAMLKRGREKIKQENVDIKLLKADCRKFELNKKFKMIFMPLNALHHLHDHESIKSFFQCVKKHLDKNGKLIFNVTNPLLKKLSPPQKRKKEFSYKDKNGQHCCVYSERTYDLKTQLKYNNLYYYKKGKMFKKYSYAIRYFFPQELDSLIKYNGFKIIKKFGDFNYTQFNSTADHQVLVCKLK